MALMLAEWSASVGLRRSPFRSGFAATLLPAGGGADLIARMLADKMREGLAPGTQIVVENKTGSGGKIAVDALRASPADGGTLLLAPLVTPVPSQLTFKNPGYNPATDMTPIGMVGHFQFALAVPPNHPAKNIAEFVTRLKANKKKPTSAAPAPAACRTFLASCSTARLAWTWCMWPTTVACRC